jgi:hypothetical protein
MNRSCFECTVLLVGLALGQAGCWDSLTDPNRPVREIGNSDKIAQWALQQDDYGQRARALSVLFLRAGDTRRRDWELGETALYDFIQVLNSIEDQPPDLVIKDSSMWTSAEQKATIKEEVSFIYANVGFSAANDFGSAGVYFRIRPRGKYSQWLPDWQEELNLLQKFWNGRMLRLDAKAEERR